MLQAAGSAGISAVRRPRGRWSWRRQGGRRTGFFSAVSARRLKPDDGHRQDCREDRVNISIFGMGYVGVVGAGCLLRDGHRVTGVDPAALKIEALLQGDSPINEPGLSEMLAAGKASGRLRATTDPREGLVGCEMVWICVGTPSRPDGSLSRDAVEAAARQIGTRQCVIPAIEQTSGLRVGRDLRVVFHPEFLREGSAVPDFDDPPKIVVGEAHAGDADPLLELYARYPGLRFRLSLEEAEMVKFCDNLFHAVKVTFANEVGLLAKSLGVDARRVANVFCADTKLNISAKYLRPGFSFGGSCLPKDLRAILREAALRSVRVPMLEATLSSNAQQIDAFVARVLAHRPRAVGMVGLAFKPDTDDMRESPYVTVAKRLIGEGIKLRIYDPGVRPAELIGRNRELVQAALGHLEELLVPTVEELRSCELIIINHATVSASVVRSWLGAGIRVMDIASIPGLDRTPPGYEGVAW